MVFSDDADRSSASGGDFESTRKALVHQAQGDRTNPDVLKARRSLWTIYADLSGATFSGFFASMDASEKQGIGPRSSSSGFSGAQRRTKHGW